LFSLIAPANFSGIFILSSWKNNSLTTVRYYTIYPIIQLTVFAAGSSECRLRPCILAKADAHFPRSASVDLPRCLFREMVILNLPR
jgi:hypothetical protein